MNRSASLLAVCTGLMFSPLFTSSGSVRAQTIFIDDATVYTMGVPSFIQDADVLIRNGVVVEVGNGLIAPVDATLIEAFGRPVTPAFFAGVTALGLEEISAEANSVDQGLKLEAMRPEFDVTLAYNPFSTSIPVTRIEGYGWTMLGASRSGSIIGGVGRAVSLDGGYDSFLSEPALFIGLGAQTSSLSGESRAAQFMLLNQAMAESGTDPAWIPDALLTLEGRRVLAGFRDNGVVVFDVDRAADILQVLAFAERNSISPVISGGAEAWMLAETLADAGVPVLLDPFLNLPGTFDQIGARLDNAAILHDAGVTIAFTGGGDTPHNARKLRQGAGVAVANGLPFDAAIAALTVNPADIFRLQGDHGRIVAGSAANLVIWSGDPLEVTSLAETVVLDGQQIPMVSRQTLLRDRYLPENPGKPRAYIKP
jgi:hypothetical protein